MIDDAFRSDRLIGMIQPRDGSGAKKPGLYKTGCAGKIVNFTETVDGRYMITLNGVCRFHVDEELDSARDYRRVKPNWEDFKGDLAVDDTNDIDKSKLTSLLKNYFHKENMNCDWDVFDEAPDERLITALTMICPFEPNEKQALLEADTTNDRAKLFMTMLEISMQDQNITEKPH